MYFASRVQAGRMLASRLVDKYKYENCAIVALDDGSAVVGAQIAIKLHSSLNLMASSEIKLPMEPIAVAGITNDGAFAYNTEYSSGELEDLVAENRGFVEQEKLRKLHDLNQMLGPAGMTNKNLLKNHNIIVVADGLKSAFEIDLVYEFLKPIKVDKLIFAVAIASVPVVDRMHVLGDELYCLDVLTDYINTNHYFDNNDIPSHKKILEIMRNIILNWQ